MSTALRATTLAFSVLLLGGCAGLGSWEGERKVYNGRKPASAESPAKPERTVGPDDHLVQAGDTVYAIAFRNSLDFRELARWNGIGRDYLIRPGQVLRLKPPAGQAPAPAQAPVQVAVPSPVRPPVPTVTVPTAPAVEVTPAKPEVGVPVPVAEIPPPAPQDPAVTASLDTPGFQWTWPTNGVVTRGYEPAQGNKGLDFTGTVGQPVFAAAPGRVVYSGNALKGYGELIIIKHDEVHLSAYGYNRQRHVKEGDVVTTGQPIGEMGLGPENKALLHFEIREKGKPVNPVGFLPAKAKPGAKSG